MIRVKTDNLCAISTSVTWLDWLSNYEEIYNNFIIEQKRSSGCTKNKELMVATFNKLVALDSKGIYSFLSRYNDILEYYDEPPFKNDSLVSFPRRKIINSSDFRDAVSFLSDKLAGQYIIINKKIYVEYLTSKDSDILKKLNDKSWLINKWKEDNYSNSKLV